MPEKLIIFPFGGNARETLLSIMAINRNERVWDVTGFIDDDPALHGKDCLGVKVLGGREILKRFPDSKILAVPGNAGIHLKRREIIESLGIDKKRFVTIIDPSAAVSPDAKVGCNTSLMRNVFVSCGAVVGDHCVVLPNTVISHDSSVGDYCSIGSNVSISGFVVIGPMCYVGSGVSVRELISIGKGALIGLGANVISDIEEGVVAVGNPARGIRRAQI